VTRHLLGVAILLIVLLTGLAQAEEWTQGLLAASWDNPPPAYVERDVDFNAGVSANYDPGFAEGTEWYWLSSNYEFVWSFSPDGSGSSTSENNHSVATGSFPATNEAWAIRVVSLSVSFGGRIHADDQQGGRDLDISVPPITIYSGPNCTSGILV